MTLKVGVGNMIESQITDKGKVMILLDLILILNHLDTELSVTGKKKVLVNHVLKSLRNEGK